MDLPESSPGFDRLALAPAVLSAVQGLGYESPTPIQVECIPHLLAGRDLLGQAQTGTGKTAAFALPILSRIELVAGPPQVLVLTPTRELALQVAEAFQRYARGLAGFHVLPLYGGQGYGWQIRQLERGPQVIVGTPGRVMDHLRRGHLDLDGIRTLVLDEADEMLNMGFAEDIEWIFGRAPAERQVVLFSATMPVAIREVAHRHLVDPVEIRIAGATQTVETIDQHHCLVTRYHKLDVLTRVLEVEPFDAMLIFVRTKTATLELAETLVAHGFSAQALNGDMTQTDRERTVERLKDGRLDILVATDVAARGLDVERIGLVVNYDIPYDPDAYVHRIGRTGRAGRAGRALLFVEPRERHLLRAIEKTIGQRIPLLSPPTVEELSEHRIERFTATLRATLTEQDLDFFHRLVTRIAREEELDPLDIAAALTYLVQRERPLAIPGGAARAAEPAAERGQAEAGERPARQARERRAEPEVGSADRERHQERPRRPRTETERPAFERRPRPSYGEREERERPPHRREEGASGLVPYRVEVGRRDGAGPREIVGAIANEAGLEGRYIGRVDIRDDYALVDLPDGMPREVLQHLRRVYVCGRPLEIHRLDEGPGRSARPYAERPRPPRAYDREARPPRSTERPGRPGRVAERGERPARPFERDVRRGGPGADRGPRGPRTERREGGSAPPRPRRPKN
ncbi:MAG: DEAD/DEAH box helicase [Chromatiaceae bacterium]|jgi:ATP-dependent RNA helicase DeaD|nr:DEAD/DEAH box helicase [Chromatiaceae bacterium]